jgi:hypothetical protein
MPSISVESFLKRRDANLYQRYALIKHRLLEQIQTRWCSQWPEGNDHGPTHIERVLNNLGGLIGPQSGKKQGAAVGTFELFLSMLAIVAHDIGIIKGREGHAESSAALLADIARANELLFDDHSTRILQTVIRCHSSSVDLVTECERFARRETFAGQSVRPGLVAALVRLSDELDEDRRRAERWVGKLTDLPEASRPYWEFCQHIQGIDLGQPGGEITFDVVFSGTDIGRLVRDKNETLPFVKFFARKMAKINRERQVTSGYLGEFARQAVKVSVKALEGVDKWIRPRLFYFTDGGLDADSQVLSVNAFLREFPELIPDSRQTEPSSDESVEASGKATFEENARARQCHCDSLSMTVKIDADGDGRRSHGYKGFRYLGPDSIDVLPGELKVSLGSGHIEHLEVVGKQDDPARSDLYLYPLDRTARLQRARIMSTRSITSRDKPIDFSWGYDAINTYAMSAEQFRFMYTKDTGTPLEFVQLTLTHIPVREANIHVDLPSGFAIEGEPVLQVLDESGNRDTRLEERYGKTLDFQSKTNMVSVRIPFPPLGFSYRVQWKLRDVPPLAGRALRSLSGQAKEVSEKLLRLAKSGQRSHKLATLLAVVESVARKEFDLDSPEQDWLEVSLMAFDEKEGKLLVAAANLADHDPQWGLELEYGDGIAGRAYKMNQVRLFSKALAIQNKTPFYYVPVGGGPISGDGQEVHAEAILSLPLSHPNQPEAVFGILNFGSRNKSSRLVDITRDQVTTEFRRAVSKACFIEIVGLK